MRRLLSLILPTKNWRVVLLCLITATTFWFFNALNKDYNTRLRYPLEFDFERDSVIVVQPLPENITIDVSSGGWNLLKKTLWLSLNPLVVTLDNPTEIKFLTRPSLIPLIADQLEDLNLNFIVTDTIYIDIEPKRLLQVALLLDSAQIPLASMHRITSMVEVNPDSVMLVGPESQMGGFQDELPIRLRDANIDSNYDEDVPVETGSGMITAYPDEVSIRFRVDEFVQKTVSSRIETSQFPTDSSIYLKDSLVNISFMVKREDEDDVSTSDFSIFADLSMLNKTDSTITPVILYTPDFIYDIILQPDTLKVIYEQ